MAYAKSLLCIHRDPARLTLLQAKGIRSDNFDPWNPRIADEIKKVRPDLPIVVRAESIERRRCSEIGD
jgi:hypothetical protein